MSRTLRRQVQHWQGVEDNFSNIIYITPIKKENKTQRLMEKSMRFQCLDVIFFLQTFSLLCGFLLWCDMIAHACTSWKAFRDPALLPFRTGYAPFGSLQMSQHRTGNNTTLETIQTFEEKVLQGFYKGKGPNTQTTASQFYLVWYGLICLILPLLHLPVCHFQPKMSSVMRGLDVSLQFTCYPHPSSDDLRTFPFHGLYCVYVTSFC